MVKYIEPLTKLETLELSVNICSKRLMRSILLLHRLTSLRLICSTITVKGWESICTLTLLTSLNIHGTHRIKGTLFDISHLTNLTRLRLSHSPIHMSMLSSLDKLVTLDLPYCDKLNGFDLSFFTSLSELNVDGMSFTEDMFNNIFNISYLTKLRINKRSSHFNMCKRLSKILNLTTLRIEGVNERDLKYIGRLTKLKFDDISLYTSTLNCLTSLTKLKYIKFNNIMGKITHLNELALLRSLREIKIFSSKVRIKTFEYIADTIKLYKVSITNCAISNKEIEDFSIKYPSIDVQYKDLLTQSYKVGNFDYVQEIQSEGDKSDEDTDEYLSVNEILPES
jgi:hypothetical protein